MLQNRDLLAKADMALGDLSAQSGTLTAENAKQFLRVMIVQPKLLGQLRVAGIPTPEYPIAKIQFAGRIVRSATPGKALSEADRAAPSFSDEKFSAKPLTAEVDIPVQVMQENIEREKFAQTILSMIAEKVGADVEDNVLNGDTASANKDLTPFNGLLKQATSNVYNAADAVPSDDVWKTALKSLPKEFAQNKNDLRLFVSHQTELEYRDALAARNTPLGDKMLMDGLAVMTPMGVPIMSIPLIPETISGNPAKTRASALLCHPKNGNVGVWQGIKVESDKDIRAGVIFFVVNFSMDAKWAHEPAVVKVNNIVCA